jgi:hypothetical protein
MAYGLYLSLDQSEWFRDDFSADNKLTGTLYTDINQTSAKDLTGYTITVRLSKTNGIGRFTDFFNKTASIVVAANGTWEYAVTEGDMPRRGVYYVTVQISKSGARESTLNRVEFNILEGPTA